MALAELDTALTDLAQFKAYLKEEGDADKGLIEDLIKKASGLISVHCDRKFQQDTYVHYFNGRNRETLYLHHWPVTSPITGIWVDEGRAFGSGTALTEDRVDQVETGSFVVGTREEDRGAIKRIGGTWLRGWDVIKVSYQAGYQLASLPHPVVQAANRLTAYLYSIADKRMHAKTTESVLPGGGSFSIVDHVELPKDVKDMLRRFRKELY